MAGISRLGIGSGGKFFEVGLLPQAENVNWPTELLATTKRELNRNMLIINESPSKEEANPNPDGSSTWGVPQVSEKCWNTRGSDERFDDHAPCRYSLQFNVMERSFLGWLAGIEPCLLLTGGTGMTSCVLGSADSANMGQKR